MIVPLWSLIAGKFSYFLLAFSHTCRTQTSSCLPFVVLTAKMSPVQFFWLPSVLYIIFSAISTRIGTMVSRACCPWHNHYTDYTVWALQKSSMWYKVYSHGELHVLLGLFRRFRKIAKATISIVTSRCPSAWSISAVSGWIFMKFFIRLYFENLWRKFVTLKHIRNNEYFTWKPMHIYDCISLNSS